MTGTDRLDYLLLLLQNLPARHIPLGSQHYQFARFQVAENDVEMTGSAQGALNRTLEITFGNRSRGPIQFSERGPGLEAVVEVLQRYITGNDGENILLWKWVDDLSAACVAAYTQADRPLPSQKRQSKRTLRAIEGAADSDNDIADPKGPKLKKARHGALPELEEDADDDSMSLYEFNESGPGSEPAESSDAASESASADVHEISSDSDEDNKHERTTVVKKKALNSLLLLHDSGKRKPPRKARKRTTSSSRAPTKKQAAVAAAGESVTAQSWNWPPDDLRDDPLPPRTGGVGHPRDLLAHELAIRCFTKSSNRLRFRCSQVGCYESWSLHLQPQRVINHALNECNAISDKFREVVRKRSAESAPSAKAEALGSEESDEEPAGRATRVDGSLLAMAKAGGREALQIRANQKLTTLICDAGFPYTTLDRDSWKDFVLTLNRGVNPISSSTFANNFLVAEAARAVDKSYEHLRTLSNLTISYDGGTTRLVQSVYTIHVTEPVTRQAHLVVGDEQSGVSHTGEHIAAQVEKVMVSIGVNRFALAMSDNTGNTRLARELLVAKFPTLYSLPDPTHHLNNTIGDICGLAYFQKMVAALRQLIQFFKSSSFAAQHLRSQRMIDGRRRGLQKNNKTRFGLVTRLGNSALFNLDSIKELVDRKVILITPKERRSYTFLCNEQKYGEFRLHLRQMLAVTIPIAKALKCLESPQCNPGDTYKFWLAIMATISDLFDSNDDGLGLPQTVITSIRRILNMRYKQMIEGNGGLLIKAALFLDPDWIGTSLWRKKNPNPLARATRHSADSSASTTPIGDDTELREAIPSFSEIGTFLGNLLKAHLQAAGSATIAQHGGAHAIRDAFHSQFIAYVRQTHPFNRPAPHGPLQYWTNLHRLRDAKLLAIAAMKILSMVGNSMCEERTMSNFTWLNSINRGSMKVRTIVQYTQVKQHNNRQKQSAKNPKPTVAKFRELAAHVRSDILGVDQDPNEFEPPEDGASDEGEPVADDDSTADDTDVVFQAVECTDTDSALAAREDIPSDSFSPESADGVDLLAVELRDMLSDVALCTKGGGTAQEASRPNRTASASRVDDVDVSAVDFGF